MIEIKFKKEFQLLKGKKHDEIQMLEDEYKLTLEQVNQKIIISYKSV